MVFRKNRKQPNIGNYFYKLQVGWVCKWLLCN
jgi:hypothetical protein